MSLKVGDKLLCLTEEYKMEGLVKGKIFTVISFDNDRSSFKLKDSSGSWTYPLDHYNLFKLADSQDSGLFIKHTKVKRLSSI